MRSWLTRHWTSAWRFTTCIRASGHKVGIKSERLYRNFIISMEVKGFEQEVLVGEGGIYQELGSHQGVHS